MSVEPTPEEAVARAVRRLMEDYQRQGGLDHADVVRQIDRVGLPIEHAVEIDRKLAEAGIELEDARGLRREPSEANNRRASSGGAKGEGACSDLNLNSVSWYYREIGRFPLLDHETVLALSRQIHQGEQAAKAICNGATDPALEARRREGERAKERLVQSNLRLITGFAREYAYLADLEVIDLIQDGVLGLIRAAEKFDHTLGYRFSTYAMWWIRQAVLRAIQNTGATIRLPSHVHDQLQRIRRTRRALRTELEREPTARDIAAHLPGVEPEHVQFLLDASQKLVSLDVPVHIESDLMLSDVVADPNVVSPEMAVIRAATKRTVRESLEQLDEREHMILTERFGIESGMPRTLEDIGQELGLSRERVRQIEARALKKLQRAQCLASYRPASFGEAQ